MPPTHGDAPQLRGLSRLEGCAAPLENREQQRTLAHCKVWVRWRIVLGNWVVSNASAGRNCALPLKVPNPSPERDKILHPLGSDILQSTGAGVWRKVPRTFPHSMSALDHFCLRSFSYTRSATISCKSWQHPFLPSSSSRSIGWGG